MSTSNPAPGVGGTAKDGGLSTAASVADGGPSAQQPDNTSQYLPPGGESREKPSVIEFISEASFNQLTHH